MKPASFNFYRHVFAYAALGALVAVAAHFLLHSSR